ncbi:8789_t:CDS:2 [Cetraspora pellucida]|uniref:8789_t:CDS:1 n=1 Tax=Cetraspora pellucida TaxID=1433469 RepID=A0A9N9GXR4_9GLOM|nr:8789_t:CDS:2 [Cetraspora pellucida]
MSVSSIKNYNTTKILKKAKELIENIINNNMSENKIIVKYAKNNLQCFINNS